MPLKTVPLLALLLLVCFLCPPAEAQRRYHSIINITGYVNFVSDYFYRGTSRTNGEQTVQGDAGINFNLYGSLRIGFWGSGIAGGTAELRRYAHYSTDLTPTLGIHFGGTRYSFPGTPFGGVNAAGAGRSNTMVDIGSGPTLDEIYTGFSTSILLFRLAVTYHEPIENLEGSEAYTLAELSLPLGVWLSSGSNNDVRIGYRFRFNKLSLGVTIHDNNDSISSDEIDNIWRDLRNNNYAGDDVVFNLQASF